MPNHRQRLVPVPSQPERKRPMVYLRHKIPVKYAEKIADILAARAGANIGPPSKHEKYGETGRFYNRADFIHHATHSDDLEYRFQGFLGFGGKFRNHGKRWYIDCYTEDETPLRRMVIRRTNDSLAELFDTFLSEWRHIQARKSRRCTRMRF